MDGALAFILLIFAWPLAIIFGYIISAERSTYGQRHFGKLMFIPIYLIGLLLLRAFPNIYGGEALLILTMFAVINIGYFLLIKRSRGVGARILFITTGSLNWLLVVQLIQSHVEASTDDRNAWGSTWVVILPLAMIITMLLGQLFDRSGRSHHKDIDVATTRV